MRPTTARGWQSLGVPRLHGTELPSAWVTHRQGSCETTLGHAFASGYEGKLPGGSKRHAAGRQRAGTSRFPGTRAKHGARWAKNGSGRRPAPVLKHRAVRTLQTVTLGQRWDLFFYSSIGI